MIGRNRFCNDLSFQNEARRDVRRIEDVGATASSCGILVARADDEDRLGGGVEDSSGCVCDVGEDVDEGGWGEGVALPKGLEDGRFGGGRGGGGDVVNNL